jgi:hypothetical protein
MLSWLNCRVRQRRSYEVADAPVGRPDNAARTKRPTTLSADLEVQEIQMGIIEICLGDWWARR